MSDQWGTREQPCERDPGRLCAEHFYLLLAVGSIATAVAAYILDASLPIEINRGAYAILVSFFVAGYCGWLSRSSQRRLRAGQAEVCDRLAAMAAEIEQLRDELARQRVPRQRNDGRAYMSTAVGGEGDSVPPGPTVAPETMAVLRRINMKIVGNEGLH